MPDENEILVYVVDDDKSVRQSLELLFFSANMKVMVFESAKKFLECDIQDENVCLIADITMKGMSGLELQKTLIDRGSRIPVIFLTGLDSVNGRDEAQRAGAVSFFRKPVDDSALIDAIHWAVGVQQD
jgi:two-component system response regulator FixJ